jgi:mannosyltransferase
MRHPPPQIRKGFAPHYVLLLAILGGGFALRVASLGRLSLWLDEAISWRFAHFPLYALWHEVLDTHPPLYYSLLHLWLNFGDSEAVLRSLSVLAGTVSIAFTYLLGRRLADARVGFIASALVAASALQIDYSREARSYALLTAAGLAASIGVVEMLTASAAGLRPRIGSFAWYVLGMLVALYAHNVALLLFVLALMIGFAEALRIRSVTFAWAWLLANGIVVFGWLWWLPVVIGQGSGSLPELAWLKPPDLQTALAIFAVVDGPSVYFRYSLAALLFAAVAAAGLAARPHDMRIAFIGAAAIGLPLGEIAISLAGRPVFMERTVVWLAPYFLLLVARAFVAARRHAMVLVGVGLLVVIELIGVRNLYQKGDPEPWRTIARTVAPQLCDGDVILLEPYYIEPGFSYYFPRLSESVGVFGGYIGSDIAVDPRRIRRPLLNLSRDAAKIASAPRIWLIAQRGGDPETIEQTRTLLLEHHSVAGRHDTPNLSADLFAMRDGAPPCDKVANPLRD